MNSKQLEHVLLLDNKIKENYIGIYPINELIEFKKSECLMIVNLDPSYMPGSHWVVLYKKNNQVVEYFDSVGNKPKNSIINHLFAQNLTCIYNNKRVQDYNTNTCGLYCLFYSYYGCRNCNLNDIIHCFSNNLKRNESIVKQFMRIYMKSHM